MERAEWNRRLASDRVNHRGLLGEWMPSFRSRKAQPLESEAGEMRGVGVCLSILQVTDLDVVSLSLAWWPVCVQAVLWQYFHFSRLWICKRNWWSYGTHGTQEELQMFSTPSTVWGSWLLSCGEPFRSQPSSWFQSTISLGLDSAFSRWPIEWNTFFCMLTGFVYLFFGKMSIQVFHLF